MIKNLFLDFDGVLCDSSLETARTGWLAGSELWEDWKGREVPYSHLKRFRKLRPLIETGHEAIALMKAIDDKYSDGFLINNFPFLMEQIFTSCSCNTEKLVELFGTVRDNWIKIDPEGWVRWHRFYPGISRFLDWAGENFSSVFIVTRKQNRFAEKLLSSAGIPFNSRNIIGLESGKSKTENILEIIGKNKSKKKLNVIIEDRLLTLYSLERNKLLESAALCLASWGYVLPAEIESAAESERINVMTLKDLIKQTSRIIQDGN